MEAIVAIVIFVLMFALIILDKIPRHYITLDRKSVGRERVF